MSYLAEWLRAFALTEIVEIPIVVLATRALAVPAWRRASLAFFASLATHPIVWFVVPEMGLGETARIGLSEAWAFGAELAFYVVALPGVGVRLAALVSLAANTASFGVGVVLWRWG